MSSNQWSIKYRPETLDALFVTEDTKNLVNNIINNPPKGILLRGLYGQGKTTLARILANTLSGFSDMNVMELDAGKNSDITSVLNAANWAASNIGLTGRNVLIIDECHRLRRDTASALLKATEDCANATFIYCTANPENLLKELVQRCITVDMSKTVDENCIKEYLTTIANNESIDINNEVIKSIIEYISKQTESMREAVNTFQEVCFNIMSNGSIKDNLNIEEVLNNISRKVNAETENATLLIDFLINPSNNKANFAKLINMEEATISSSIYMAYNILSRIFKVGVTYLYGDKDLIKKNDPAWWTFSRQLETNKPAFVQYTAQVIEVLDVAKVKLQDQGTLAAMAYIFKTVK